MKRIVIVLGVVLLAALEALVFAIDTLDWCAIQSLALVLTLTTTLRGTPNALTSQRHKNKQKL